MPESAECQALRKRLRELAVELKRVLDELKNEPFGERRAQLQARAEELDRRMDHTRARMEELQCDPQHPPPPPPDPPPVAPTLAEFGHSSINVLGKKPIGPRRLLVVLLEWDDNEEGRFPRISSVHPLPYYEQLAFGHPTPPFATDSPVNPASLTDYIQECSLGRFWFTRIGILGPAVMGPFGNPDDTTHVQKVAQRIAELGAFMLYFADDDASSVVTSDELVVLVVENHRDRWPANRPNAPVQVTIKLFPFTLTKTLQLDFIAFAGPFTPFYQIAHEVVHSLGAKDMYNGGGLNYLLTVMGSYSFDSNDQGIVHLDAWHKLALGWCEPRRAALSSPGSVEVVEISPARPDGAVILWHPSRRASEYFLVERRRAGRARDYDASFPGDGVLIWHIDSTRAPMHRGTPNLDLGTSGVWTAGTQTPPLTWTDGSIAVAHLAIDHGLDDAMVVSW